MARILIVDDEAEIRVMLNNIFNDNYEIVEATNGVEAKKICDSTDVDLMITDIVMPEMHGVDLVLEIRRDHPDMPIIAMSGGGGVTGRFDYLKIVSLLGVDEVMQKPFETTSLRKKVKELLENKKEKSSC